jgi:hypothetical protein
VTQRTFKSYDLQPTVFTGQSVFSIAELLDQRARQLVANEQTRAENAERDIIARFDAEVSAVNAEIARVKLLAESLGDAELAQLEDSLLKVLTQPAFQELLSGGSLDGFKLNSIVKAIKDQPDVAHIERMSPINGVASVIRMGFTDGRSSVLSADIVNLPADEAAGTPERLRFDYKTNDFLGLPAVQKVLFNVYRFPGSDKPWLEEVRRDLILFDLTDKFLLAGTAPTLLTPDLNLDGRIGSAPAVDPVAAARAALDAALAEKIAATQAREAAQSAKVAAQAEATRLQTLHADLVTTNEQAIADAGALVDSLTLDRNADRTAVTAAEQALTDAEAGGDPAAIDAAAADLATKRAQLTQAEQTLVSAVTALAALQTPVSQARVAAENAAAEVTVRQAALDAALAVEAQKTAAAALAQQVYDDAVAAVTPAPAPAPAPSV